MLGGDSPHTPGFLPRRRAPALHRGFSSGSQLLGLRAPLVSGLLAPLGKKMRRGSRNHNSLKAERSVAKRLKQNVARPHSGTLLSRVKEARTVLRRGRTESFHWVNRAGYRRATGRRDSTDANRPGGKVHREESGLMVAEGRECQWGWASLSGQRTPRSGWWCLHAL